MTLGKFKEESVALPDGSSATIREFSAARRDAYEQSMIREVGGKRVVDYSNMRAKLVAFSWLSPDGKPAYTEDEIAEEPSSLIEPLYQAAQRVNAMDDAAVDTAEKNSATAPSSASDSA